MGEGVWCVCDGEQAACSAVTPADPLRESSCNCTYKSLLVYVAFYLCLSDARRVEVLVFCLHLATAIIEILQGRCVMTVQAVGGDWLWGRRRKANAPAAGKWPPVSCKTAASHDVDVGQKYGQRCSFDLIDSVLEAIR